MNLVTLRDVSVAYDGYEALRHVDLEIADLEIGRASCRERV